MKPELQRIRIAEACGWRRFDRSYEHMGQPCRCIQWEDRPGHPLPLGDDALPDYLNDLNAMHEAERVKFGEPWWCNYGDYLTQLRVVIRNGYSSDGPKLPITACATAAQRAEAFLRTLGLWEDSALTTGEEVAG